MKKCLFLALVLVSLASASRAEMRDDGLFIPKVLFEKMRLISHELRVANGKLLRLIDARQAEIERSVDETIERKPRNPNAPRLSKEELADLEVKIEEASKEGRELSQKLQKLKTEAGLSDIE